MHSGHKSRAITLNEIIPLAIPYHSFPIPISIQSLKKIGHGNEALMDRQTDGQMDNGRTDTQKFGGYNIIPRHFLSGGV